jgi:spermidine synthase
MTLIQHVAHHFSADSAFTSMFLLSESHISFHSWPERGYIAVDVFTCGNCDAKALLLDIAAVLKPKRVTMHGIVRGDTTTANTKSMLLLDNDGRVCLQFEDIEDENEHFHTIYKSNCMIETRQSPYQKIAIVENRTLGKCMFIDDILQVCEMDVETYNQGLTKEMFHYFKANNKTNNRILVVGGGDGFLVEHLLHHYNDVLSSIVVVELDVDVVSMASKHFHKGRNVFTDQKKVTLLHDYGEAFVKDTSDVFDGIIVDCTDFDPDFPALDCIPRSFIAMSNENCPSVGI